MEGTFYHCRYHFFTFSINKCVKKVIEQHILYNFYTDAIYRRLTEVIHRMDTPIRKNRALT